MDSVSPKLSEDRPSLLLDAILFVLFLLILGWGIWGLLFRPDEERAFSPSLPSTPSYAALLERIHRTQPIPAAIEAWTPPTLSPRWRYIVIHHSGTPSGNAAIFHRYHLEDRHWENGLGYHFVIGNGHGSGDGEVEVGTRWKEQLDGAHVRRLEAKPETEPLNRQAIGICLVGNFEEDLPTERQIESLKGLLNFLIDLTGISEKNIEGHQAFAPTQCPGRYLPVKEIVRYRRGPSSQRMKREEKSQK